MSAGIGSVVLSQPAQAGRRSWPRVALGLAAIGGGALFGLILASPLDVRPWVAAAIAACYACAIAVSGSLLLVGGDEADAGDDAVSSSGGSRP